MFGILLAEVLRNDQMEKMRLPEPKPLGSPRTVGVAPSMASSSESLDDSPHPSMTHIAGSSGATSATTPFTPGSIGGDVS